MQRLLMIGLNHATAPLEVRERCAFTAARLCEALAQFKKSFAVAEFVIISTCNRVELYTARPVHAHPRREELFEFLCKFHGLEEEALKPHIYQKVNRAVADHLFTVAASLDSMVIGETQILGQVREAYEAAGSAQTLGPLLNPLFQRAIAAAREVQAQTHLTEGRRSIASIAVDYAQRIFDRFDDKTVLSIGAGKMSRLVLTHLAELHVGRLLVTNRDIEKAKELAQQFGGQAVPFEQLPAHLAAADIVVSGTAAPQPIITRKAFESVLYQRRYRPVFLIDIALPRDIEPSVGELDNVYLYNIDDLQTVVAATNTGRQAAADAARQIILGRVDEFVAWHHTREAGPLIEQLFSRSHELAREEVKRTISKLPETTEAERAHLEDLARRIVNKLLNDPVQAIRSSNAVDGVSPYLHAMTRLFRLNASADSESAPPATPHAPALSDESEPQ